MEYADVSIFQTSSWAVSVAQAALTSLNLVLYWISYQRHRTKTDLKSLAPTISKSSGIDSDQMDQSPVDYEKEQGYLMGKQGYMVGRVEEQEKEEEVEEEPLAKKIRKPAFKQLLGYITTFVGVFN